jgi:hypothetical protein
VYACQIFIISTDIIVFTHIIFNVALNHMLQTEEIRLYSHTVTNSLICTSNFFVRYSKLKCLNYNIQKYYLKSKDHRIITSMF